MDTIFKTFRPEVKSVDNEDGTIDMLIPMSTASIDRDGESIDPLGWKKSLPAFRKRPVLLSSHGYGDLRKQIGEFKTIKLSEDGLLAKPKYYINEGNEEADWAFKLASKGMAAYSVGFIPKVWVDGDGEKEAKRTYTEQELLEISHVVVPSNRDAIQGIRGKSTDPMINNLIEDIVNAEIVDLIEETVTKPEETDEYIRIPINECKITATIDISKEKGIKALYCGKEKQIATYLFAKDKGWTMEKAKAWVKEHEGKSIREFMGHKITQEEIIDEFDYIRTLIISEGISGKAKDAVWKLVDEILRISGSDIPVEIKNKFTVEVIKYIETGKSKDQGEELIDLVKELFQKQEVK